MLSGITPGRLGALHWQVLDRLRAMPMSPKPFARLAEHAEMAGDPPAILEFAVAAGDSAASLGSHREAAFQYGRAMPYADLLDVGRSASPCCGKRALECQVADDHEARSRHGNRPSSCCAGPDGDLEVVDALLADSTSRTTRSGDNSHGDARSSTRRSRCSTALAAEPTSSARASRRARRGTTCAPPSYADGDPVARARRSTTGARPGRAYDGGARADADLGLAAACSGERRRGTARLLESLTLASRARPRGRAPRGPTRPSPPSPGRATSTSHEALALLEDGIAYTREHDLQRPPACASSPRADLEAELGRWDEAMRESHDAALRARTPGGPAASSR